MKDDGHHVQGSVYTNSVKKHVDLYSDTVVFSVNYTQDFDEGEPSY